MAESDNTLGSALIRVRSVDQLLYELDAIALKPSLHDEDRQTVSLAAAAIRKLNEPVPMLIWCPMCHARHIDEGEFATKPHSTHSCQSCGFSWKPSKADTVGVQFLPGYKNGR